jgi:hypothetical protein
MESPDLISLYENILTPAKSPQEVVHHYTKNCYSSYTSSLMSLQQIKDHLERIPNTEKVQEIIKHQEEKVKEMQFELNNYILKYFK